MDALEFFRHVAAMATMYADSLEVAEVAEPAPRKRNKKAEVDEIETGATTPSGKKPSKKTKKARTLDEVKGKLVELSEVADKQAVKDVLSRFGVTKLGDLPEENYNECHDVAVEAIAEATAEPEPEDDDDDLM